MFRRSPLFLAAAVLASAQPPAQPQQQQQRRPGGFIPGQQRPTGDAAVIARGKSIYEISCRACHGADLRGGDIGGPNLLRSQVALSDRDGEKIAPIIQAGLPSMPAIPMSAEDAKATATYVRSVLATIGGQGRPPSAQEPPSILVGNAGEGKAFFSAKCAACHAADGDLKGLATRINDPRMLQNTWVAGGGGGGRRGGGQRSPRAAITATVTQPDGTKTEGKLIRIDHFLVTLELADGSSKTFTRNGEVPKVEVNDPLSGHRELLAIYTDKDIHDVTAYLVTLK